MEAEYVAACEATKEVFWLRKFLTNLEVVHNILISSPFIVIIVVLGKIPKSLEATSAESI